jgi:Phosphotransferase enzyme family
VPPDDDLLRLASLAPAELAGVASAAAGHPVRDPRVRSTPVPYDWGSPATAGLWRTEVRDGPGAATPACTFFVKLLRHPRLWPGLGHLPDQASRDEFVAYFPWRYELDMYESGIGAVLPPGMRTPALHHVGRPDADHLALWWEFVPERPGPWQLADYRLAAGLLGRLAARRRAGAEVNRALPAAAQVPHPSGSSLRFYTERRVLRAALPALRDDRIWAHPVLAAALRQAGDPRLPADMAALGDRLPDILDMLDGLPQTHAHGDASPQNLLLPAAEPGTVVVIDWGFGDLLPVGFDLGQLLTGLALAGLTDPAELAGIDGVIFGAYLDGLAAEGYQVAPELVRAGYLGSLAARSALCSLPLELLAGPVPDDDVVVALLVNRLRVSRVLTDLAAGLPAAGVAVPAGGDRG